MAILGGGTFTFLLLLTLTTAATSSQSAPPKFGDRIGKLKRNFQISSTVVAAATTVTPSTTTSTSTSSSSTTTIDLRFHDSDLLDDNSIANDISRSDSYVELEDHHHIHNDDDNRFMVLKDRKVSSPSSSLVQARFEMQTDFFDVPPSPLSSVYSTLPARPPSFNKSGVVLAARTPLHPTITSNNHTKAFEMRRGLRDTAWAIPVLALALLSMLAMVAFEAFVLCKTRQTSPNRRHLFLGQMLLLGLFTCAALAALLAARPSTLSCATVRFAAGVGFALIFASLLVKCVFLISLNGGVYLPAPYQALLLFFAVLIQVTVDVQWLLTSPPAVVFLPAETLHHTNHHHQHNQQQQSRLIVTAEAIRHASTVQACKTSFSELRLSMLYIDLLIVIVAVLAVKSRGIRDNYREASFIGLAVALVVPVWLGWSLVGLAVHERHKDACLAFALLATSTIVFLVMFMPKGRQLAAMGREDLFGEDRDERFSASSRAGSGYSPSFFHFKPIKYGVMGGKGALGSNELTGSGGGKHQQAVTTLGGDYALVVPMSYYTPPLHNYSHHHHQHHHLSPLYYYTHKQPPPHYAGLFMQDDANAYTTLEQTMSSNPNVYFQRQVHPGMIY